MAEQLPPIDPQYEYLFRGLNPQSVDKTQEYLDLMRQRGVSGSLGTNVLGPSAVPGAPAPGGSNEAANAVAQMIIQRRQQLASMDPLQAQAYLKAQGIRPTISLGGGSTTTQITPPQMSPEAAAATAAGLRQQEEETRRAYGITEPPKPGFTGPLANPEEAFKPVWPEGTKFDAAGKPLAPPPPEGSFLWHQQRAVETYKQNIEKNNKLLSEATNLKKSQAAELERANANLRDLEGRINRAEIDPDRFYRGPVGAVRAILGAVAAAFGAYAQGLSGGKIPNTAVEIIQRAIDRDIDAQKANLQKLMQQRGFAADTRNYITNRFDAAALEQKAYTLRQTELEFAKQLQEANEPRIRVEGSKLINELHNRAILAEEMGKEKRTVTKVSSGHTALNPMYAESFKALVTPKQQKEQPISEAVSKRLNDSVETVRNVDNLVATIDRIAPNRFEFMNYMNKDKAAFEKEKLFVMQQYRKAVTGAQFGEKESEEYMKLFDANTFVGWQAARNFLQNTLRKQYQLRAVRALREAEGLGKVPTQEDWDAILRPGAAPRPDYAGKSYGEEGFVPRPEYQGK
jgi:hypothetical protein